ncbi:MAG: NADH:flavin oxidoreductase, partial [Deltaproteobacteria bacterium]|nr:NADH:flavin oxidoreductase [Deltaproteobacteria bacterium]
MADALDKCFSEAKINRLTLRNRLIKAATFEGKSPGGVPSDALISFHERIGQGGIGMTTIAYCAAEADGRIHEHMMYMHE